MTTSALKTEKQKQMEKAHQEVIDLYKEFSKLGGAKTAMWQAISEKTGYTRENIQRILRINGIDYSNNTK